MTRSDCAREDVRVRRRRSSASADGGTAWRAIHSRTGAPRGATPPHNVTIQACVYANKSSPSGHAGKLAEKAGYGRLSPVKDGHVVLVTMAPSAEVPGRVTAISLGKRGLKHAT